MNQADDPSIQSNIRLRSELLKATIEFIDDNELIVRTDENGSVELRGSANVPMFLALWKAPKHRLPKSAFLEVERRGSETNFDRHRARLCARLQDALIEVVEDGRSIHMRKCRA